MVALCTCKACVHFEMVLTSPSAQHVMPLLGGTRPAYLHIHQQRQHKGQREHAEGSNQGDLQQPNSALSAADILALSFHCKLLER